MKMTDLMEEPMKPELPKQRNFVAKNAITSGAGKHKDKKKDMKQGNVKHKAKQFETATTGSTSAGSVASVPNPTAAKAKITKKGRYGAPEAPQKKNADGTVKNALDVSNNLMGGKTVRR